MDGGNARKASNVGGMYHPVVARAWDFAAVCSDFAAQSVAYAWGPCGQRARAGRVASLPVPASRTGVNNGRMLAKAKISTLPSVAWGQGCKGCAAADQGDRRACGSLGQRMWPRCTRRAPGLRGCTEGLQESGRPGATYIPHLLAVMCWHLTISAQARCVELGAMGGKRACGGGSGARCMDVRARSVMCYANLMCLFTWGRKNPRAPL